jgi:cell division septal protein FtsQ
MIKRKINLAIKLTPLGTRGIGLVVLGIIILIALFFIISHLTKTFKALDYFKIKDVMVVRGKEGFDFSYLVGRNIFNLDLKRESGYISELYPAYKKVRLIKALPDRLFVVFTERQPLAYVKLYRYFCVDSDRVLFAVPQGQEEADLPVITGLETKIFGAKPGKQYNIKELVIALNIIKEAKIHNALRDYQIKRIDVANPAHTACFMIIPLQPTSDYAKEQAQAVQEVLEVKIGQGDISDKMRVLGELFIQLKKDLSNIKYIDLRFKEPVIKFKNAQ